MNIYNYKSFLEKNTDEIDILYHGSPYIFESFKDTVTFFSDIKEFASDYADTKSMDMSIDNETNIYTIKLLPGKRIFNIHNDIHFERLKNNLPNKVTAYLTNFGFPTDIEKIEILNLMRGIDIIKPMDNIISLEIGEEFENPEYKSEKFIVFKKDDEYLYSYDKKKFSDVIESIPRDLSSMKGIKMEMWKIGSNLREFIDEYIKEKTNKKIIWENDRITYYQAFLSNLDNFYGIDFDKVDREKFYKIYKDTVENIKKEFLSNKSNHILFTMVDKVNKLSNTWQFFENETVLNIIKKMGFIGYVALERDVNTYAIFNPSKTVKIINYEIPRGRKFETFQLYKNFIRYKKDMYNYIKNELKDNDIRIYDIVFYTSFIENYSKEEMYDLMKKYQ